MGDLLKFMGRADEVRAYDPYDRAVCKPHHGRCSARRCEAEPVVLERSWQVKHGVPVTIWYAHCETHRWSIA